MASEHDTINTFLMAAAGWQRGNCAERGISCSAGGSKAKRNSPRAAISGWGLLASRKF